MVVGCLRVKRQDFLALGTDLCVACLIGESEDCIGVRNVKRVANQCHAKG